MVWNEAPRSREMSSKRGGSTRNREWFREWANPSMSRAPSPRFMAVNSLRDGEAPDKGCSGARVHNIQNVREGLIPLESWKRV